MAKVHILNVTVNNNPAPFFTPFQFEINFECLEDLQDDLEFKIIYVGSAETVEFDQTLDQIVVDAVPKGQYKFMFEADPPDVAKIPADDAVGVTVALITATFRGQEFVRIGYYVNNEYDNPELRDNPPAEPKFDRLVRTIAQNQPRVTKFKINWDSSAAVAAAAAAAASTTTNGQVSEMNNEQERSNPVVVDSEVIMIEDTPIASSTSAQTENKENQAKSESMLFQAPAQQPIDKSFMNNTNSNMLFENSIDAMN